MSKMTPPLLEKPKPAAKTTRPVNAVTPKRAKTPPAVNSKPNATVKQVTEKTTRPARAAPAKTAKAKATATVTPARPTTVGKVKAARTKSARPVRAVTEPVLEGGAVWKMSGRHGVAYVKDASVAGELLATDPKNLAKSAMAVYYNHKGKAIAWQVRFDTDRWDEVCRRLA